MSLQMVVGEDFPRAFWMLDDNGTMFADYSGYEKLALTGQTISGVALVKGARKSLIVSNTTPLVTINPGVFVTGREHLPWAVEVFVRPVISDPDNISEQQVYGNQNRMDGLVIEGTKVSFVTKYANTGEARASFDMMDYQNMHLVGLHTKAKNQLFINGELVGEADITPEQQEDSYALPVAENGFFVSGQSMSTNQLMINGLAVYDHSLDEDSILRHYATAQDVLPAEDVAIDYGGGLLEFATDGQLAPLYQIEYSSTDEWNLGTLYNASLDDGTLYPSKSGGVSVPGHWETVAPLGIAEAPIYAANLIWEGTGATVFTSRDGESWEQASKGVALTTVPRGTSGEDEFLFIRVAFEGGLEDDPSYFDNMVFSLYTTNKIPSFGGHEVTLDRATPESDYDVIDLHENWGVELQGGSVTIKAGIGETALPVKTIEVWANKGGATFTDNLVGVASRWKSNGGAQKSYAVGEWQLRHYVFDSGFTGDIVFSGTGQIGHIVIYPEALSDATIKEIYDSYTGKPKITLNVDETFDIHEFNDAVDIYEYDWAIESAG